jgi:hypothetical protein
MTATAKFRWTMFGRADIWWSEWHPATATYDHGYIVPKSLLVLFDGQPPAAPGDRIVSEHWEIEGLDHPHFHHTIDSHEHETTTRPLSPRIPTSRIPARGVPTEGVPAGEGVPRGGIGDLPGHGGHHPVHVTVPPAPVRVRLPGLGRYRVTLTVATAHSGHASTGQTITARDRLVASPGDSLASGEGNPDNPANGVFDSGSAIIWTDHWCHRSHFSGHALAVVDLEQSHRTVTFLSHACPGARIGTGITVPYAGEEPPKGAHGPHAHINALADAIGQDRTVDTPLITIGVNDLGLGDSGFSSIVDAFDNPAGDGGDQAARQVITAKLARLPERYDEMAFALSKYLDGGVGQVYITQYPVDPFLDEHGHRAGCHLMEWVSHDKTRFLFEKGTVLNRLIVEAAERHGWRAVTGITEAFHGHGYRTSDSWYVGVSQSVAHDHTLDGSMRPNHEEHRAIARRIVATVRQGPLKHTHRWS